MRLNDLVANIQLNGSRFREVSYSNYNRSSYDLKSYDLKSYVLQIIAIVLMEIVTALIVMKVQIVVTIRGDRKI